jgi:hypothetical protein
MNDTPYSFENSPIYRLDVAAGYKAILCSTVDHNSKRAYRVMSVDTIYGLWDWTRVCCDDFVDIYENRAFIYFKSEADAMLFRLTFDGLTDTEIQQICSRYKPVE